MRIKLVLILISLGIYNIVSSQTLKGERFFVQENQESFHYTDLSDDGNVVAIASPLDDNINGVDAGSVSVYQWDGSIWQQFGSTIYGNLTDVNCGSGIDNYSGDYFGSRVSLNHDGTIIAISGPSCDSESEPGYAKIFQLQNNDWVQLGSDINDTGDVLQGNGSWEGRPTVVKLNGNGTILAIGNNTINSAKGHIKVFEYTNNNWTQVGDPISGDEEQDQFGNYFEINDSGTIIVTGTPGASGSKGEVKVYERIEENWNQLGQTITSDIANSGVGKSVNINNQGNFIAVSTDKIDGTNPAISSVSAFKLVNGNWSQVGNAIIAEQEENRFGLNLDINSDGTFMIITSSHHNNSSETKIGKVTFYSLQNDTWELTGNKLFGNDTNSYFGLNAALSGCDNTVSIVAQLFLEVYDITEISPTSIICSTLSLNENTLDVSIYPNPTLDIVFIEGVNTELEAVVFDFLGKQVMREFIIDKIDISHLEKGAYIINLTDGINISTYKIIKN